MPSARVFADDTNRGYWHLPDATLCIGCLSCREYDLCGGLKIDRAVYSCMDFCTCAEPSKCDIPCPNNPSVFVGRMREVETYSLDNISPAPSVKHKSLPNAIPILYGKASRRSLLNCEAVAIRLRDLFSARTGKPRFKNRRDLADRFCFSHDAKVVVVGVSEDNYLELYWERARSNGFPACLHDLDPALVTTPNFSVFSNVPRWADMHSVKRIAICWHEMASAGLPTSVHVNARTPHDYLRWTKFLIEHEEIQSVAFEFGTGAGIPARTPWHLKMLKMLGTGTRSRLKLILKGGRAHLGALSNYYRQVIFLDSSPYMKTISRRMHFEEDGKVSWESVLTLEGQGVEDLLDHNVKARKL